MALPPNPTRRAMVTALAMLPLSNHVAFARTGVEATRNGSNSHDPVSSVGTHHADQCRRGPSKSTPACAVRMGCRFPTSISLTVSLPISHSAKPK